MEGTWVNHSGGVIGADTCWQQLGAGYKVSTRAYRPFDNPAPENPSSIVLNQAQLCQANHLVTQAAKLLNINFKALPLTEKNYIRKNYFQVVDAEALFIVARILRDNNGRESVAGGTAWAYLMATLLNKPIFVFDDEDGCCECTRTWYQLDYATKHLKPYSGIPTLPRHFAGIGTRDLSVAGRQAIGKVYYETFVSQNSLLAANDGDLYCPLEPAIADGLRYR